MDYEIRWSPEAWEDIDEIAAYIHKDSPIYASKVVKELIAAALGLRQFPYGAAMSPNSNLPTANVSSTVTASSTGSKIGTC